MKIAYREEDVGYLPKPNLVEVILTAKPAPVDLTRTAFALPVFDDGSVMLANNQRRGIEIAGGHIDPGETPEQAAIREVYEETGVMVDRLAPIGYLRMTLMGDIPEDYRYPAPISYQQFYAGRVVGFHTYQPNDECAEPFRCSDLSDPRITRRSIGLFGSEALRLMSDG